MTRVTLYWYNAGNPRATVVSHTPTRSANMLVYEDRKEFIDRMAHSLKRNRDKFPRPVTDDQLLQLATGIYEDLTKPIVIARVKLLEVLEAVITANRDMLKEPVTEDTAHDIAFKAVTAIRNAAEEAEAEAKSDKSDKSDKIDESDDKNL